MKTAVVTGSAGFIGRHMVPALFARGYDLVYQVDVADGPGAHALFSPGRQPWPWQRPVDLIVHAAAVEPHRAAIDGDPTHMVANIHLDAAMFAWALRNNTRVLYLSSSAVYPVGWQTGRQPYRLPEWAADRDAPFSAELLEVMGDMGNLCPDTAYGWTKLAGERMAAAAGTCIPVHVVRPFSGYGEDQDERWPFGAFAARARRRADPFEIWGDGTQVRDWVHVDDVVGAALAVVDADVREPVNICTGVGTSMLDLVGLMTRQVGYDPAVHLDPHKPSGVAYRVGDPATMLRYYQPKVDLAEGVRRALDPET